MSSLPNDSRILRFGSLEEKMNREGKRRIIFGEGFFLLKRNKTEMEKEDYICRRKIYFFQRRTILVKKNEEHIWRQKICFLQGEKIHSKGKGRKYLEKENVFFCGEE